MKSVVILTTISIHNVAGGLERNIVWLANELTKTGLQTHIISFDKKDSQPFFKLHKDVIWHCVGNSEPHTKISFVEKSKLILRIRDVIKSNPSPTIICFHHGLLPRFWAASLFLKSRLISSERNSLELYKHIKKRKWNLSFLLLSVAQNITVQFQEYKKLYPKHLQKKIVHIPNKVEMPTTFANTFIPNDKGRFVILCIGRLCKQKRQTLLLNAFERVARKALDWDLLFVGEGGLEKQLKKEIAKKGLTERVSIAKNVTDLGKTYEKAHIYCQPSEWEGFPNAVAEAMAHKLPSLGFLETAGFRELIQNTKGGILIKEKPSAESLANGLLLLINDAENRLKIGSQAHQGISQYHPSDIVLRWRELLSR